MNSDNNFVSKENDFNEEIDLKSVLKAILINKKLVFFITLFSTISSVLATYTQKPIYIGSFQMLIERKRDSGNISSNNPILPFLQEDDNNKTQALILKSPSVLENVFLYNLEEFKNRGQNPQGITYKDWITNKLEIEFKDNSKVLEVSFKDEDKSLIKNTLEKISLEYKKYSKKEREQRLRKGINYLLEQKLKLKEQSTISLKKLNAFSIENGLGDIDGFVDLSSENPNQNVLREILENTNQNLNITDSSSFLDNKKAGLRYSNQFNQLEYYESLYTDYSSKLKPNSETLKELDRKIKNLKSYLKRPNEILLEFRELKRVSQRDERLLSSIENQLQIYQLDIAKESNSWEKISKVNIDKNRISPKRKQTLILSFLISFILSSLLALIKYYYFGLIFDLNILKAKLPAKYLETIFIFDDIDIEIVIKNILKREIKTNENFKVGLINLTKSTKEGLMNNFELIPKNDIFYEINLKDYKETDKCKYVAMLISPGILNRKDILALNQYINTFKDRIIGWIYINENKSEFN